MIDFQTFKHQAIETITSPTAFSWYGIVGVVATGVVTFIATCKWKDKVDTDDDEKQKKK